MIFQDADRYHFFLKINEDPEENPATFGWSQPDGPGGLAMTSARRGSKASPKVRVRPEHELWIFQWTLRQRSFAIDGFNGFYYVCFIEFLTSLTSTACPQRWTSFPVSCIRLWVACQKHHSHHSSRSLSSAWMTDCRTKMWLVSGIASPMRYRRSWATVSQQPLRSATRFNVLVAARNIRLPHVQTDPRRNFNEFHDM